MRREDPPHRCIEKYQADLREVRFLSYRIEDARMRYIGK